MTCLDCGNEISEGAQRCRACHRQAWAEQLPEEHTLMHQPGELFTGTELLQREWGKGDAR